MSNDWVLIRSETLEDCNSEYIMKFINYEKCITIAIWRSLATGLYTYHHYNISTDESQMIDPTDDLPSLITQMFNDMLDNNH
jgi:hypothetical protein